MSTKAKNQRRFDPSVRFTRWQYSCRRCFFFFSAEVIGSLSFERRGVSIQCCYSFLKGHWLSVKLYLFNSIICVNNHQSYQHSISFAFVINNFPLTLKAFVSQHCCWFRTSTSDNTYEEIVKLIALNRRFSFVYLEGQFWDMVNFACEGNWFTFHVKPTRGICSS